MPSQTIPYVSTEYLYVEGIFAFDAASPDPADPRTLPVSVAFGGPGGTPGSGDWLNAEWVAWTAAAGATARFLLSPAAQSLTAGDSWDVWLRVTGAVETPQRRVGTIDIT